MGDSLVSLNYFYQLNKQGVIEVIDSIMNAVGKVIAEKAMEKMPGLTLEDAGDSGWGWIYKGVKSPEWYADAIDALVNFTAYLLENEE